MCEDSQSSRELLSASWQTLGESIVSQLHASIGRVRAFNILEALALF